MSARADYAELVAQAERSVAAVKDPELKRVAFQKVLDELLASRSRSSGGRLRPDQKVTEAPRKSAAAKKSGPQAYVEEMMGDGFFKKPKTIAQVKAELSNRGHHIPLTSLSGPLQKLCQRRALRRQKAKTAGDKATFSYSEW